MPTEEELEQRITELIERGRDEIDRAFDQLLRGSKEAVKKAILDKEKDIAERKVGNG